MDFVHCELKRDTWFQPAKCVMNPEAAVGAVQEMIENLDREMVITINASTKGRVINASVSAIGTMSEAVVNPAEILRTALLSGAGSILLIHNHPSGDISPSEQDIALAKRMAVACHMIGIRLFDFIIIGSEGAELSFLKAFPDCLKAD